jgi:hypothetical protein
MTMTTAVQTSEPIYFDFALLRKAFLYFGVALLVMAPFARDPIVVVVCGFLPYVLVGLVDVPRMPSIIVYYLLWMWFQAATRVLIAALDAESLGDGLYGLDVYRAFWYSMASLIVLAVAFRICLGGLPSPSDDQLDEHRHWSPMMLFCLYLVTAALSFALVPLASLSVAIAQPVQAVGALKYVVMFMLFATVLSTGNGVKLLLAVILIEIVTGFSGLFSGFKTVFIVLLLAALSLRMTLRSTNILGGVATLVVLFGLGVFWTAVKSDYRDLATGFSGSQEISSSVTDRVALLVGKAIHPADIEWGLATDALLRRIAYIDFFGATIGVSETSPEPVVFARWRDALEHVTKPRIFFPDKAALDDTEIFLKYVRGDVGEEGRAGTSISIGYLAENFIDFGFPGMLAPIAALGLVLGCTLRYLMTRPVAWAAREAFVTALVLTLSAGMELSLAKFLGSTILTFGVLALCLKFVYPPVERWLGASRLRDVTQRQSAGPV